MVHPYRIIDRRKQWLDAFHSVGDRPRRDAQSLQPKLLDDTICGALQVKLFQQQVDPQARTIDALGKELGWQRRGDGSRPP